MGSVYEVVDGHTAARRALKVMLASVVENADQRARFTLEARVTGDIESDHLVRIFDSGVDEELGTPFLTMELLRGEELGDKVARTGPLPAGEVMTYLSQAARALDKTHAAGVVHRDLKPGNLFITTRDDGSPCVKILDFGIAKVVAQNEAQKTKSLGTPLYMAPEQIRGDGAIEARADLYALAHVAYALLVAEPYWDEESKSDASLYPMLMKILTGAAEPPCARALRRRRVTLPPGFDEWFARATAVDPALRYEKATTEIAALGEALDPNRAPRSSSHLPAAVAPPPSPPPAAVTGLASPMSPLSAQPTVPYGQQFNPATAGPISLHQPPPSTPAAPPSSLPAPSAPAALAPPRPFPIVPVAIAGVVAAGLVGALAFAVWPARSKGESAPAAAKVANAGCGPGFTCVTNELPDPAHADLITTLSHARQLALGADKRASLTGITAADVKDGVVDLTAGRAISYQFMYPEGTISVGVRHKQSIVGKGSINPFVTALPDPKCSVKDVWRAAVGGGAPATSAVTFSYFGEAGGTYWNVMAPKLQIKVDAKTCTVKSTLKL